MIFKSNIISLSTKTTHLLSNNDIIRVCYFNRVLYIYPLDMRRVLFQQTAWKWYMGASKQCFAKTNTYESQPNDTRRQRRVESSDGRVCVCVR